MDACLRTDRLLMRRWLEEDRPAFAAMNADPEVMRYFPAPLDRGASDVLADRCDAHLAQHGWGLWALEVTTGDERGRFAGFTGLSVPSWPTPWGPCVEIGWRLPRWAWGRGYATEAATAALGLAFTTLHLPEVVSFTAVLNTPSQAVMRRLGMTHDAREDFLHPALPAGHPLRPHVLHRLTAAQWRSRPGAGPRYR